MATPELVQLKVLVPKELRRRLKVLAAETGKPMNELVTRAITVLVQRKGEL
jgi:predicted DNA-binding protein